MTRACPGCGQDLTGAYPTRKWCSELCRKRTSYGGTCESCGATTNGSNGPGTASRHCNHCAGRLRAIWSKDRIVEKLKEWLALYGAAPTAEDWSPSMARYRGFPDADEVQRRYETGEWPPAHTVQRYFGSWSAAVRAADLTPRAPGERGPDRVKRRRKASASA